MINAPPRATAGQEDGRPAVFPIKLSQQRQEYHTRISALNQCYRNSMRHSDGENL
jgi:hypothetical protein